MNKTYKQFLSLIISFALTAVAATTNVKSNGGVYCQDLGECAISQKFYVEKPFKAYVIEASTIYHTFWNREYPLLYDGKYFFTGFPLDSTIIVNNNIDIYVLEINNDSDAFLFSELDFCQNKSCQVGLSVAEYTKECIPSSVEIYSTYYIKTIPSYHFISLNVTVRMGVKKCNYPVSINIAMCALNNSTSKTCHGAKYEWMQFFEKIKPPPPGINIDDFGREQ